MSETKTKGTEWIAGPFDYERLEVSAIAEEAFERGYRLANGLPRGNANLADQMKRSLLSAFLQTAEGASRRGGDRLNRFNGAKSEAGEAAAALKAAMVARECDLEEARATRTLLARLCAMLTKLGG